MGVLIPTTVIGIGTSGCKSVAWLSRLLYQEFKGEVPPIFRLAVFETAQEGFSEVTLGESVKQCRLAVTDLSSEWNALRASQQIDRWFPSNALKDVRTIDATKGAGGRRVVGRLCLWAKWNDTILAETSQEQNERPYKGGNIDRSIAMLGQTLDTPIERLDSREQHIRDNVTYVATYKHQVYIIGSAVGGTASGAFTDVVHAASQMAPAGGKATVVLLLTLPPERLAGADGLGTNPAASLLDVKDMLLDPPTIHETVTGYPTGAPRADESPATAVYLLGPSAPGSRGADMVFDCSEPREIQEGLALVSAYWIYWCLFGLGEKVDARAEDYPFRLTTIQGADAYPKQSTALRAVSLGGAARPAYLLAELVTKRFFDRHRGRWTAATADQEKRWRRAGAKWMDEQLDKRVNELAIDIEKELVRAASTALDAGGGGIRTVSRHVDTLGSVHEWASKKGQEIITDLGRSLEYAIDECIDNNRSLAAGQRWLKGAEEALKQRNNEWSSAGVDTSGLRPSPAGVQTALNKIGGDYEARVPTWLGGPSKSELGLETARHLAIWAAACYETEALFTPNSRDSIVSAIKSAQRSLSARTERLEELNQRWEKREKDILRLDSLATGTVALLWYHKNGTNLTPAGAAAEVYELLSPQSTFESARMDDALGGLAPFLKESAAAQMEQLQRRWTQALVLPGTVTEVDRTPLHEAMGKVGEFSTLLALNNRAISRPYFSDLGGARAKPLVQYHSTQAQDAAPGYELLPGVHQFLRHVDLRCTESAAFTLNDLLHFPTWRDQLLNAQSVLDTADPYGAVRRHLGTLSKQLVRFVRDVLVDWKVRDTGPVSAGLWSRLDLSDAWVRLQSGPASDVLLNLDGSPAMSLGSEWEATAEQLSKRPQSVRQLLTNLKDSLRLVSRVDLQHRWAEVSEVIPQLYPDQHVDMQVRKVEYGVDNEAGDLGYLVHN